MVTKRRTTKAAKKPFEFYEIEGALFRCRDMQSTDPVEIWGFPTPYEPSGWQKYENSARVFCYGGILTRQEAVELIKELGGTAKDLDIPARTT